MSGEVSPDWLFDTNKKIAALTKNVFRLHAETIDRKNDVANLKEKCKDDLAAAELASQKEIETAKSEVQNYRETIDAIVRRAYETEFAKVRKQFEDSKAKLDSQGRRIIEDYNIILKSMKAQVDDLQKKTDEQLALFQNCQNDLKRICNNAFTRLRERNQREMEARVADSNLKYESFIRATAKKEENLKQKFEREIEKLRQTLMDDQKRAAEALAAQQQNLNEQTRKLEPEKNELLEKVTKVRNELAIQKEIAERYLNSVRRMKEDAEAKYGARIKQLEEELYNKCGKYEEDIARIKKQMENDRAEFDRIVTELKNRISKIQEDHDNEIKKIEDMLNENSEKLENQKQCMVNKHKQEIEKLEKDHEVVMKDLLKKENELKLQVEDLEKKHVDTMKKLQEEIDALTRNHMDSVEQLNRKHREEFERVKKTHEEDIRKLTEELGSYSCPSSSALREILANIAKLKQEIDDFTIQRTKEENEEKRNKEDTLRNMKEEQTKSIERMKEEFNLEKEQTQRETETLVEDLERSNAEELGAIERAGREKCERETKILKERLLAQRQRDIDEIKAIWEKRLLETRTEINAREKQRAEEERHLADEISRKKGEIDQLRGDIAKLETGWAKDKANITDAMTTKLHNLQRMNAEAEKRSQEEQNQKRNEYELRYKQITEAFEKEQTEKLGLIEELKKSVEFQRNKNEEDEKTNRAEMMLIRSRKQSVIEDLQRQIEKLKQDTEKRLNEIESERQTELQQLTDQFDKMTTSGEAELKRLRKDLKAMKRDHEEHVQNIELRMKLDREENHRNLTEIWDLCEREISDLKSSHRIELVRLRSELQRIENEQIEIERNHREKLRIQKRDHEEQLLLMKQRFEHERDELSASIRGEQKAKSDEIARLEAETKQYNDQYNSKEARPEDIEKIRTLEAVILERTEAIAKAQQDLKKYQSELLNKETTYNKVFNNKPQKAVLAALERKQKRDQLIASVGPPVPGKLPPLPDNTDEAPN